jgi:hypothetical protein
MHIKVQSNAFGQNHTFSWAVLAVSRQVTHNLIIFFNRNRKFKMVAVRELFLTKDAMGEMNNLSFFFKTTNITCIFTRIYINP